MKRYHQVVWENEKICQRRLWTERPVPWNHDFIGAMKTLMSIYDMLNDLRFLHFII